MMNLETEKRRVTAELREARARIDELDQELESIAQTRPTLQEACGAAENLVDKLSGSFDGEAFAQAMADGEDGRVVECLTPMVTPGKKARARGQAAASVLAGLCWLHPAMMKQRLVEQLNQHPDVFGSVPGDSRADHAASLRSQRDQWAEKETRLREQAEKLDLDPDLITTEVPA